MDPDTPYCVYYFIASHRCITGTTGLLDDTCSDRHVNLRSHFVTALGDSGVPLLFNAIDHITCTVLVACCIRSCISGT